MSEEREGEKNERMAEKWNGRTIENEKGKKGGIAGGGEGRSVKETKEDINEENKN